MTKVESSLVKEIELIVDYLNKSQMQREVMRTSIVTHLNFVLNVMKKKDQNNDQIDDEKSLRTLHGGLHQGTSDKREPASERLENDTDGNWFV